jgi:N-acyl-D-aspartate/D-glutamate deacylase
MLGRIGRWVGIVFLLAVLVEEARAQPSYEVVLRGGRIVDGCGTPWYRGDVALKDGRIVAMGRLDDAPAKRTIDASGLVVAPGFIDMMGQSASSFLEDAHAGDNLLTQGITTINAGEGESAAPLAGEEARRAGWATMAEYFDRLDRAGMPMNAVQTVGHTQVRSIVIGDVDRQATPAELERMKGLVREAMEAGAIGLSTSLIYPPAVYASTEEIIALDRVVAAYGGRYYTHMRNEGDRLLEAIDEALAIGKSAGTPVHIFHLKAAGRANWPKMEQALARIKAARDSGQVVGADIYPYINNGLGLAALIHPRHSAEGAAGLRRKLDDPAARAEIRREMESGVNWENWFRHVGSEWDKVVLGALGAPPYAEHNGKSLSDVARAVGQDPWDVFFAAVRRGAAAMPESMTEANVIRAMRQEFISFDTDMGPAGTRPPPGSHPRGYGAFPRVLGRYVRDLGVLSLEGAVQRMTAVAANELMLADRGRLVPGAAADIVVFDADQIHDRATFAEPHRTALGVRFVLVGGQVVLDDGKPNGARPGRVLRGPGYRPGGSLP